MGLETLLLLLLPPFQRVTVAWDVLWSWYWQFWWSLETQNFVVAQENVFNISWALFRVPGCHYYHWRSISLCRCCVVFIIHIGSKWHICRHHLDPVLVPCIVVTTIGDVGWGLWHGSQSLLVMVAVHMVSLVITNNKKKRTQGSRRNASRAPRLSPAHPLHCGSWHLHL